MGFDVIRHHGETEQRHGCICKGLGQSYMYPFRYIYMMAMVTRLQAWFRNIRRRTRRGTQDEKSRRLAGTPQ